MSLNWQIKAIVNFQELCWIPLTDEDRKQSYGAYGAIKLNPVTDALIWSTMLIGMASIREKNWEKFADRIRLIQAARGTGLFSCDLGEYYVSREEVRQHIGLSTNADSLTDTAFLKRLYETRDCERSFIKATEATKIALAEYRSQTDQLTPA